MLFAEATGFADQMKRHDERPRSHGAQEERHCSVRLDERNQSHGMEHRKNQQRRMFPDLIQRRFRVGFLPEEGRVAVRVQLLISLKLRSVSSSRLV